MEESAPSANTELASKSKYYSYDQCSEVDSNGVQCTKWRCQRSPVKGMCILHGKLRNASIKGVPPSLKSDQGRPSPITLPDDRPSLEEFPLQFARVKRLKSFNHRYIDKLLKRQNFRCADPLGRCPIGQNFLPTDMAELDHIVPICEGGTHCITNLQAICACCHRAKTSKEQKDRFEKVAVLKHAARIAEEVNPLMD